MTPAWHDGPLGALAWDGRSAVVWNIANTGAITAGPHEDARSIRRDHARALIGMLAACPPDRVRLTRTPAGAPVVDSPNGWHVSFSSRGSHSLIGVARQPIAVDRELVDDHPPLWDMLTPDEADALRRLPRTEQSRAWLRLWTIKEAHAKLIGAPRRIRPEAIETRVSGPVHATASFEGTSRCWTRSTGCTIDTIVHWDTP